MQLRDRSRHVLVIALLVAGTSRAAGEEPCKSIRPGLWKGIAMMLAVGGDERRRDAGPHVPVRSDAEGRERARAFWSSGVRAEGANRHGAETCRRLADGSRIVLVPGGDVELGAPARMRDKVPRVVVKTDCPAYIIRVGEPVRMEPNWVVREQYPARRVTLDAFAIDETEVTWAQYRKYQKTILRRDRPKPEKWQHGDHPVTHVTWHEAAGYCDWVGGRLPTDEEWELAARGFQGLAWPWGDTWPPPPGAGNFGDASLAAALCQPTAGLPDDGFIYTAPVGSFPAGASPFGVLDLKGNASEWVGTWHDEVDFTVGPVAQPCPKPPPAHMRSRVQRGGSFFGFLPDHETAQAWMRTGDAPWMRDREVGFRCAHDPPP